jgi:hypothetical protein
MKVRQETLGLSSVTIAAGTYTSVCVPRISSVAVTCRVALPAVWP